MIKDLFNLSMHKDLCNLSLIKDLCNFSTFKHYLSVFHCAKIILHVEEVTTSTSFYACHQVENFALFADQTKRDNVVLQAEDLDVDQN